MNMIFKTAIRPQHGMAVIDLFGEINAFADQEIQAAYAEAESLAAVVVLNFTQVTYVNSTGIALIVGLLSKARKSQRRIAVYGLSEHYTEIFQITRLTDFLDIFPDEASVLHSLASGKTDA